MQRLHFWKKLFLVLALNPSTRYEPLQLTKVIRSSGDLKKSFSNKTSILVIIFWNFTLFLYRTDLPQVKRKLISSITNLVRKLPNNFTLNVPCISESCIEIKIKLNFYFHTSLWCLKKRFYEGLKGVWKYKFNLIFSLRSRLGREGLRLRILRD